VFNFHHLSVISVQRVNCVYTALSKAKHRLMRNVETQADRIRILSAPPAR